MVTRRQVLKGVASIGLQGVPVTLLQAQECPLIPEIVSDYQFPPAGEIFKTIVTTALGYIPDAGTILSVFVGLFWPPSEQDVWGNIKSQVEQLIDQKIDGLVYAQLQTELNMLGKMLPLYVQAARSGDMENIRGYFRSVNTVFTGSAARFQIEKFEWLLAPLFAIYALMHLNLLREGILYGRQWGWTDAAYEENRDQLRKVKVDYANYLSACVRRQRERLQACEPASPGKHMTAIYDYWQPFEAFEKQMIGDYLCLIDCFSDTPDATDIADIQFPDVYSATFGTADNFDTAARAWAASVVPAFRAPLSGMTTIDIELFNNSPRIVDIHYTAGSGPMMASRQDQRADQVSILGRRQSGVEHYTVALPPSPPQRRYNIESAIVRVASIPLAVTLVATDGSQYQLWDRSDLRGGEYTVAVPGRMLTTLNMWTYSNFYDFTLGCILFGFSRDPGYVSDEARRMLYITAVKQPESGNPLLPEKVNAQLLEQRALHWAHIARQVHRITGQ